MTGIKFLKSLDDFESIHYLADYQWNEWRPLDVNFCSRCGLEETAVAIRKCQKCLDDGNAECTVERTAHDENCEESEDPYGEEGISSYEEELPFAVACPNTVCGEWSEWTTYSACSKQCNRGTRSKTRRCYLGNEERPDEDCGEGESVNEMACNTQA